MPDSPTRSPGDEWSEHYRGYRLQVSPNGEVWWQLYNGTDRLKLDPAPTDLVEDVLNLKAIGGRIRITESNDVITKVESDDDEYDQVWIGEVDLDGQLVPDEASEFAIDVRPEGLSPGDLWPSVYDGAKYAYSGGDRVWWPNPESHMRHPVETDLSADVFQNLRQLKRNGGSFRVTPWQDVITLVPFHPTPEKVEDQFGELPRVVRNIIRLRKERGVEMLPIYVGSLDGVNFDVGEAESLTDPLSESERRRLESWAKNLGSTTSRSKERHTSTTSSDEPGESHATDGEMEFGDETGEGSEDGDGVDASTIYFDDDPIEWQEREFDVSNP